MREIKFRAWDRKRKRWVYFYLYEIVNINHESLSDDEWAFIQMENVCQYIGLEDINDKEIYEGDIIKGEWIDLYTGLTKEKISVITDIRAIPDYVNCEVIGNIYENPELLKEVIP